MEYIHSLAHRRELFDLTDSEQGWQLTCVLLTQGMCELSFQD